MSRIGKKEICIPKDTIISIKNNNIVVKGKHGILEQSYSNDIEIEVKDQKIFVISKNNLKNSSAFHGLTRTLIQNMILGVNQKFLKVLIAEGVGYKFQLDNNYIILSMGYSHIVKLIIPNSINVKLESPIKITISGISKQEVGLFASRVRSIRPPEPYKGKGIRYENEIIRRKVGKTGK